MNKKDFVKEVERLESEVEKGSYNNPYRIIEWIDENFNAKWGEELEDRAHDAANDFWDM